MAATAGLCYCAKQAFLDGTHGTADTYKLAFYSSSWVADPSTLTAYSATNEVTNGSAIPAGGVTLASRSSGNGTLATAYIDWADISVTVTGSFTSRYGLIYNASKSNAAIGILDWGADKTATDGPYQVQIPASGSGLIRFA
jgi:hypothetical protein